MEERRSNQSIRDQERVLQQTYRQERRMDESFREDERGQQQTYRHERKMDESFGEDERGSSKHIGRKEEWMDRSEKKKEIVEEIDIVLVQIL